jgi:hypothetical protein
LIFPFFFPAELFLSLAAGSERGEEPAGNVIRLIQIRLATPSLEKILPTVYTTLVREVRSYTPAASQASTSYPHAQ